MPTTLHAQVSEDRREDETARYGELLRKACRPVGQVAAGQLNTSPDKVLTSLAQLATCQTKTERSLISLFNESRQYIVAEATPSTSLLSNPSVENSNDGQWLCGTHIPRADGVCHYTLCATEQYSASHELPVLVVQDLAKDPRFASSPYCRPRGSARFYAAVPIRSPRGINIGILCVINSTPGGDWQEKHSNVLRGLSQTIMDHLEGNRIKHSLKRSTAMSLGLQRFTERGLVPSNASIPNIRSASSSRSRCESGNISEVPVGQACDDQSATTKSFPLHQEQQPTSSNPFLIAATIIKETLEADNCAFFSGDSRDLHIVHLPESETQYHSSFDASCLSPGAYSSQSRSESSDTKLQLPCQLLGSSNGVSSNSTNDVGNLSQFFLSYMLRQYPEGCILDFDSRNNMASHQNARDIDTAHTPPNQIPFPAKLLSKNDQEMSGSAYEQRELLQAFPGARNIAFIPIWDPLKGVLSIGGFVWSKTSRRASDRESELPFIKALGILAASEAFQIETLAADKAKSDVLGSISHELRSPLHGITLGLELLNDSGLGAQQQNIAQLIETCCRTLLDTTEHLLEFSKVNRSLEPDTLRDGSSKPSKFDVVSSSWSQSLNKAVRLDQIAEDVVESIYTGHSYQHALIADIFSPSNSQPSIDVGARRRLDSIEAAEAKAIDQRNQQQHGNVSVFLLYDPTCSWVFRTRAGAIRRIIMNLLGNSLKYTSQGFIKVSMTQIEPKEGVGSEKMVELVVEDTGRGISEDFLRNNIFKPFSQEDQLSTGTGLGLSFVQKITSQLGGTISIKSQVDVGTKVTVSIPMLPCTSSPASELLKYGPHLGQSSCRGLRVRLATQSDGTILDGSMALDAAMSELCYEQLGMVPDVESDADRLAPDIVIVQDSSVSDLSEIAHSWPDAPVLVVCNNALAVQRYESAHASTGRARLYEFVAQPLSPNKLESAVSRVINIWAKSEDNPQKPMIIPLPTPSDTASCVDPPTPSPSAISPFAGNAPAQDYFQTPQFLLVEDNPINLKMLTCFMRKLHKSYRTAVNGQEAVDAYKETPGQFKYVLMDISMPVMDGLEATRQIRAFERFNGIAASKILAITGLGSESTREEATRSGVDVFVTKPVKLRELETVIDTMASEEAKEEPLEWSMYPELHDDVAEKLDEDDLGYTSFENDDDDSNIRDYDTNIKGSFQCDCKNLKRKKNKNKPRLPHSWSSNCIAVTIREYDDDQYNVRVYHQRCKKCKTLCRPTLNQESYVERVVYRIKKWNGVRVERPEYSGTKNVSQLKPEPEPDPDPGGAVAIYMGMQCKVRDLTS
ncbi:peroxide stress-activated histidine kinase mak2 [Fusarium beomiforme]|uniref:Peroxide stress-activated histidine kinase mak2 n=1 Tax=Fusarium beomiforme TaxID=44412 RepID=A0A9P5DXY2_9HYPO|nr:peroxide stress-activated histidine kinase mak2 [Fusarium beomiforme]